MGEAGVHGNLSKAGFQIKKGLELGLRAPPKWSFPGFELEPKPLTMRHQE